MKRIILLLIIIIGPALNKSSAEKEGQERLDSLLSELPKASHDSVKVRLLIRLSFTYRNINPDEGLNYAFKAVALARELNWKKEEAQANNYIGINFRLKSNYPEALVYILKALKISEEIQDKKGMADAFNNLGLVYTFESDYSRALEYCEMAFKINTETKNQKAAAANLLNIGSIYMDMKNYPKALECYTQTLKFYEEISNKTATANSLASIGSVYRHENNYDKAFEYFFKALRMTQVLGDKNKTAGNYSAIGEMYLSLAAEFAKGHSNHNKNYENFNPDRTTYQRLAKAYTDSAIVKLRESGNLEQLFYNYKQLSEIQVLLTDHKGALESYQLYTTIKDSVFSLEKNKKLTQTSMQYEFDKKEAAIKAEEEKKGIIQRTIRNSIAFGLASALIFLVVVYRQRNKISKEKKRSDELVIEKEMLMKEMHHRVKNNLEVISSLLELQSEGIEDSKAKAAVIEGQSRVQSIALIHHKLYRTDEISSVEFKSFANDLYKQVASVFKKPGTEVNFNVLSDETQMPIDIAVPVGLILNELFTNTFKYAVSDVKSTTISIQLQPGVNTFQGKIIYADNGPGMPEHFNLSKSHSLGMKVIQLLTKQLGGILSFHNNNGSVFEIPFNNNPKN